MYLVTAESPTAAPAVRDRDTADGDRRVPPSRIWVLLGALAYTGALLDPTGVLAAQRFAGLREELRPCRR